MKIQVSTSTINNSQQPPVPIEELSLKFRVQIKCFHVYVDQNNNRTLETRHKYRLLPFPIFRFPIDILYSANNEALRVELSHQLRIFSNITHANKIADAIKDKWIEIRITDNYSNINGKVLPLTITFNVTNIGVLSDRELSASSFACFAYNNGMVLSDRELSASSFAYNNGMVPTCKNAIEMMLKRVKLEEIEELGDQSSCAICFEEFNIGIMKKKKRSIVKMPCFHVFHPRCIKRWLKNSHYCPVCRFQMPTE